MTSLLDDVATRGQALVLHGAPGIGKSRLLAEAEWAARERGMLVLITAGVQSDAHLPGCISSFGPYATARVSSGTSSAPPSTQPSG